MKPLAPGNNKIASGAAAATRMSIVGEEQEEATEETMEVERAESSNVVEDACDGQTLIGSEKTSADYYFDSYSHFGMYICDWVLVFQIACDLGLWILV